MKRYIVLFCLFCIAYGGWHQTREITLPKGIQVNDLSISNSGELWILSTSSILKYEAASENPFLIQEFQRGKILAVHRGKVYVIDQANRLFTINVSDQEYVLSNEITLSNPRHLAVIGSDMDIEPHVIVQEANQLSFIMNKQIVGQIAAAVERFATVPLGNYRDPETPLFTLSQNRVYAWKDGTLQNIQGYQQKQIFSAANSIFDITADKTGKVFVLFADSVVVIDENGTYNATVSIDRVPMNSSILYNPADNNVYVYDRSLKTIKILSSSNKYTSGDLITLHSNQPNPVDNYTEIEFTINQSLDMTLTIYNLIGEPVKVLAQGRYTKGTHRVIWRATDERGNLVPNGIYFYRLDSKKGVAIRQLIVLR
jgi:hypothetical protein